MTRRSRRPAVQRPLCRSRCELPRRKKECLADFFHPDLQGALQRFRARLVGGPPIDLVTIVVVRIGDVGFEISASLDTLSAQRKPPSTLTQLPRINVGMDGKLLAVSATGGNRKLARCQSLLQWIGWRIALQAPIVSVALALLTAPPSALCPMSALGSGSCSCANGRLGWRVKLQSSAVSADFNPSPAI